MRLGAAIVLVAAALGGCMNSDIGHREQNPVPESAYWDVVAAPPGGCDCPNGRQFFLVNKSGAPRVLKDAREYKNYITEDRLEQYPINLAEPIAPGEAGRKFLQCSPANTPAYRCSVEYMWKIGDVFYNQHSVTDFKAKPPSPELGGTIADAVTKSLVGKDADIPTRDLQKLRSLQTAIGQSFPGEPIGNCVQLCESGSPECFRTSLGTARSNPTGKVLDLIRTAGNSGTVPVGKILAALGQTENPCDRSDLVISNGLVSNTGHACVYRGGAGSSSEVESRIPDTLAGKLEWANGRIRVTFPKPTLFGPSIHFASRGMDADFGGSISKIDQVLLTTDTGTSEYLVLTGPKKCIALRAQ